MGPGSDSRSLRLLLAAVGGPVSLQLLADSGIWRLSSLLGAIDEARRGGELELAEGGDQLRWRGDHVAPVVTAQPEDVARLAGSAACLGLLVEGARGAARARAFPVAEVLYRLLAQVDGSSRARFPGGEPGWVALVLEATRLFRSAWTVDPAALEAAVAIAERTGDLATQAVLLAARGVRALPADPEQARRLFDRATEAAEALDAPPVRAEVRTYIAVSLVVAGRPAAGIAAFEEFLGQVQPDLFDPRSGLLLDLEGAVPASALSLLAHAYAVTGAPQRAVELMERTLARGLELKSPALQAQGHVMLAVAFMMLGDREACATHAEAAAPWFASLVSPYAWASALTLAWARADRDPREASRLLSQAMPGWRRTGRLWIGGSAALELLERLEREGLAPEGLSVAGEVARHLEAPQPLLAGMARRWAARRTASAAEALVHLEEATRLLREAGAAPELRLALEDALARSGVDPAGQARLREELAALGTGPLPAVDADQVLRLAGAVVDLGRLTSPPATVESACGDLAARLCRELGAERSAIVLLRASGPPRLLAARGGRAWQGAVLERAAGRPVLGPCFEPARSPGITAGPGQLVLVPFDDGASHRGLLALENRDTVARLGEREARLLSVLGRQVGVLLANLELHAELQALRHRLEQENRYHRQVAPGVPAGSGGLLGTSGPMRELLDLVHRVAPTTTPVLVTGETGVGKELVSRELHRQSPRRDGPFIAVHIAALAPGLVASALFGHERGAFTGATEQMRGRFELASGGTIFLDEVGELAPEDQVRLLRVLQEGTFERVGGSRSLRSDFRLVAATHRDLAAEARAGRFREDLYYRLAAFPIRVPPLRERREEIPTLALLFMERAARQRGVHFEGLSEADLARLQAYPWPGNVRELEHVIERGVLLSDPPRLRLPALEPGPLVPEPAPPASEQLVSLEEAERRHIQRVLHHVGGRVSGPGGAAEVLGLKPSTLQFRIDKLGLRPELARARHGGAP